jgi:hypothetical protein
LRSEHDLDRAIDEVARALTAGEPGAAFRARVLARVAGGDRFRRSWRAAWIAAPMAAAAAAIAIVAVLVSHSASDRRPRPFGANASDRRLRPSGPGASDRGPDPFGPGTQRAAVDREAGPKAPALQTSREPQVPNPDRISNPESRIPSAVAALAPPALSVDSIALAPIGSGDPLEVPQLAAPPPLNIPPLDIEKEIRR